MAMEPQFDILVTVTILRNGDDIVTESVSDDASFASLEEAASALGAAGGREAALRALQQEETGQQALDA